MGTAGGGVQVSKIILHGYIWMRSGDIASPFNNFIAKASGKLGLTAVTGLAVVRRRVEAIGAAVVVGLVWPALGVGGLVDGVML